MSSSPDLSVTRVGETDATIAPVITSTVRSASALAAYSRSFGLNIENSSGPGLDEDHARLVLRRRFG